MQDRCLELQNVVSYSLDGLKEFFRRLLMGLGNLVGTDSQRTGIQFHQVEKQAELQDRFHPLVSNTFTDLLDHLGRGKRLSKNLDRPLPTLLA